ncbi:alpha-tocopherol transfer protein-like [Mercenaria mercenaria]|uniref:alpha-tocopherol transfer protein-like n=1 Tax=Mercenaria mercenaria TaxID=6596 RepID=UPI00234E8470|nr:alpha-tocopherol transfer protein-like [Mercenaria mercenaria]
MAVETGDASFISKLDEEGKKKAREELHELNDKDREIAVQTFRQWVLDQDWLKTPTDFAFLLRFLRVRKFSQLGARETLENYWKGRTNIPEWFRNVDPTDETMMEIMQTGCFVCPKKYDKSGRRMLLCKLGLLSLDLIHRVGADNIYKASFLVYDWLLLDEKVQVNGMIVVVDYTDFSLQQMMATTNADISRKSTPLYQKALPMRLKGIHMYNESAIIDVFMSFVNPFLRQKIKDRFKLHGKSLVKFYEDVGMEVLPDEYLPDEYKGPSAGSRKEIIDGMLDDMMKPEFREYIKNISSDKYRVDKEKRKANDEPVASFRKLNVS